MNFKGKLLIASPKLYGDLTFGGSVIFIADHYDDQIVGFKINQGSDHSLKELFSSSGLPNFQIFDGGPVEEDLIYFLHSKVIAVANSMEIADGLYWGKEMDYLSILNRINPIDSNHIRFFAGYSGWSEEQLHTEINEGCWTLINNPYKHILFKQNVSHIYWQLVKKYDSKNLIWANAPKDPLHN